MRLLAGGRELEAVIDQAEREILDAAGAEIRAAEERGRERGFQAGLIAAGEPWAALFFGIAGGLLGWGACFLVYGR